MGNFENKDRKTLSCILMYVIMHVLNKRTNKYRLYAFYVKKGLELLLTIKIICLKDMLI